MSETAVHYGHVSDNDFGELPDVHTWCGNRYAQKATFEIKDVTCKRCIKLIPKEHKVIPIGRLLRPSPTQPEKENET